MPRKRNGWGNPDSFRFLPLGYPNKPPKTRLSGQYQANNRYGSTITRTVTEQYDLNSSWKSWRRGYEIYAHGKFSASDFTLQFKQYEDTPDEVTVYLRFYEYPSDKSDTGNRLVTIRYTDIANRSYGDGTANNPYDYRTGLTNVFKVKNEISDYASEEAYYKQKESGEIPVILNKYDNSSISQVRRAQPGSRLTDGFYSANLIALEDQEGLPVRLYGRTYNNLDLVKTTPEDFELEQNLNTQTYEYKLQSKVFFELAGVGGQFQARLQALAWGDPDNLLERFVGKIIVPTTYWNDFSITVTNTATGRKVIEKRFGEIYSLDLNLTLYRNFKILDITEFPQTVYKASDFPILFETGPFTDASGGPIFKPIPEIPIEDETDPDDGSSRVDLETNYIVINSEYQRFYNRIPTNTELDEIYRQVTTASLTIEAATILEVIDHRKDPGFTGSGDDTIWLTIICKPVKQEIQLFRSFDATNNTVIGVFDSTSFSYKGWSNGNSFYTNYTSNDFKQSLNAKDKQEVGFVELSIDPWSYEHQDMWKHSSGYQPLVYDLIFSCSCPSYTHGITKAPETMDADRQNASNRQQKYPLPGALSRALTSDNDEQSVAGNAITWADSKYTTSHKVCKHTVACMFEFGLEVREPKETPSEKSRTKFLNKIAEEREKLDYIELTPSAIQRSKISNFDIGLSMLEAIQIPATLPRKTLERTSDIDKTENTHNGWIDYGNTKRFVGISPRLPAAAPFFGSDEWDFSLQGDLELANTEDINVSGSDDVEYTFRVLDAMTIDASLFGAGGSSGENTLTRYWPYEPALQTDHSATNEEAYYINNLTFALIDSNTSEQDVNYSSAATPADTNYYESHGGIANGRIQMQPGIVYTLSIGLAGGDTSASKRTRGGGSTFIKIGTQTVLVAGGGGGTSYQAGVGFKSPGGHGGFGSSPNGTDGVPGFRENSGATQIPEGRGATTTANGQTSSSSEPTDDLPTTLSPHPGITSGFKAGAGGAGYFSGSAGGANNYSTLLQGAAGGGGGSSYGDTNSVTNINYQGVPNPPKVSGKVLIKAVDD